MPSTNKDTRTGTAVIPFEKMNMEQAVDAILNVIPNAKNNSTAELRSFVAAGRALHRNVLARELHYIKGIGVADAAVAIQADFDEDLADKNDRATFVPDWNVSQEVRDQLGLMPGDLVVLMSCYLRSDAEQWRYNVASLRDAGAPWQEIKEIYGVKPPPAAQMYGVVRQSEQTPKDWAAMDAKYPRRTRCEKRGRIACVRAVNPVTVDQRVRKIEAAQAKATADPDHYYQSARDSKPVYTPVGKMTHEQRAHALGRDNGDSLIDDDNVIQGEARIVSQADEPQQPPADETQAQPPEDAAPQDDPAINDPDPTIPQEEEPQGSTSLNLSPELVDLKNRVDRAATGYANAKPSEQFSKFMFVMMREACRKNEEMSKAVCAYLTGEARLPDVPMPYLKALHSVVIKPREDEQPDPKTGRKLSHPDPAAYQICAAIFRAFNPAQDLFN
jgi:hypothetical protein